MTKDEAIKRLKDAKSTIQPFQYVDEAIDYAVEVLKQQLCETIKEIPKDYKYDTETKDFLVYRHIYTGHEIHIEKPVPRYRLEQEPCEDCISRQDAIKQCGFGMTNLLIADCLRRLPSVKPQESETRWIPVSERLPEKNVEVLATTEWGSITIAERYSANDYFINDGATNADEDEIIAWMPLPKPYKAESEDKR